MYIYLLSTNNVIHAILSSQIGGTMLTNDELTPEREEYIDTQAGELFELFKFNFLNAARGITSPDDFFAIMGISIANLCALFIQSCLPQRDQHEEVIQRIAHAIREVLAESLKKELN